MVKSISQCFVNLDGDKNVYKRSEYVKGKVTLNVEENIQIKAVRIYLYGVALTKWDIFLDRSNRENIGREKYVGHYVTLFGNKVGTNAAPVTLVKGKQTYRFTFKLPDHVLPSSFEGEHGAIRYWLKILVDRPMFSLNRSWYRAFTVLRDIDINTAAFKRKIQRRSEKVVSKTLGFGNAGTLSLSAECDRSGYCAGEKIALTILAKNNTTKDMGRVKASLMQTAYFLANGEEKYERTVLNTIQGNDPLTKETEKKWENEFLEIDAVPPSTAEGSCHIIKVSYYIKVFVEVPWGIDLSVILNITIGTIPLKHPAVSTPAVASNSFEIDASSAITYTKCNKGIMKCAKTDGNFVTIGSGYIPMCTYVPNYQYRPVVTGATNPKNPAAKPTPKPVAKQPAAGVSIAVEAGFNAPVLPAYTPTSLNPTAPPSYEDVIALDSSSAKPETTSTIEIPKSTDVLLLARFSDNHLHEFRSFVVNYRKQLLEYDGEIFAFSPQPISKDGAWPNHTCIAVFIFPTAEKASDWFKNSVLPTGTKWAETSDALISQMKEAHNENSTYFTISCIKLKPGISAASLKQLANKIMKITRPMRIANGGLTLASGKPISILQGDWSGDKSVNVNQWESILGYATYAVKYRENKALHEQVLKTYDITGHMLFQTEELSQYRIEPDTDEGEKNDTDIDTTSLEEQDMTSQYDDEDSEAGSGDHI